MNSGRIRVLLKPFFALAIAFTALAPFYALASSIDLDANAHWKYFPEGTNEGIPITVGAGSLSELLPRNVGCCTGYYLGEIETKVLRSEIQGPQDLGLLVPETGGLTAVEFNGTRTVFPSDHDYTSSGPLVYVPKDLLLNAKAIPIKIFIEGTRSSYSGMWNHPPEIGDYLELLRSRDRRIAFQIFVPLVFAIVFLFIAAVFLWIKLATKTKDPVYHEFIFTLISWGFFYLFLSGTFRRLSTYWGAALHLPWRSVAAIALFRLIGALAGLSQRTLNRISLLLLPIGIIQLYAGLNGMISTDDLVYCVMNLPTFYAVFVLFQNSRTKIQKVTLFFSVLMTTGILADSIKLSSTLLGFNDRLLFLDRYTTPPLMLTSIVYLAYRLTDELQSSIKKTAFQEAAARFIHDIQSPVAALEAANSLVMTAPQDSISIVESAIHRIRAVCASLRDFQSGQKNSIHLINPLMIGLLNEKRLQFANRPEIKFVEQLEDLSNGPRALIDPAEFQRAISNLINNSVDAIANDGTVKVTTSRIEGLYVIEISDNGRGIPPDVVRKLGARGLTYGKPNGSGLGIHYAIKAFNSWGGKLCVESTEGIGTTVRIQMPVEG